MSEQQQVGKRSPISTVHYSVEGFAVDTQVEGNAESLIGFIKRIKSLGATPTTLAPITHSQPANDDAPTCQFHGKMKQSKRGGWFCPKRLGNGEYCPSKG